MAGVYRGGVEVPAGQSFRSRLLGLAEQLPGRLREQAQDAGRFHRRFPRKSVGWFDGQIEYLEGTYALISRSSHALAGSHDCSSVNRSWSRSNSGCHA